MTKHENNRTTIRLYHHALSGHVHRVELFLTLLGLPFEIVPVDILVKREQREPAFLARNPFGQVPVIDDGELTLADSNAILVYLAKGYDASRRWLPEDPVGAARVQRWLSVAADDLANGPADVRFSALIGRPCDEGVVQRSKRLFGLMDQALAAQPFIAAEHPTIADLALYAYTAHAPEGGLSLAPYPNLRAWLARIEALPRFVGMQRSPLPEVAAA
ncbi:MAG TPA: glutathione S-transferase [Burkholderiaceae bacterium]